MRHIHTHRHFAALCFVDLRLLPFYNFIMLHVNVDWHFESTEAIAIGIQCRRWFFVGPEVCVLSSNVTNSNDNVSNGCWVAISVGCVRDGNFQKCSCKWWRDRRLKFRMIWCATALHELRLMLLISSSYKESIPIFVSYNGFQLLNFAQPEHNNLLCVAKTNFVMASFLP